METRNFKITFCSTRVAIRTINLNENKRDARVKK